jgi:predicted nucleic acid-binding protein
MPSYLADKSALTRRQTRQEVRAALEPLFVDGEIAICGVVDLEVLYSATSPAAYRASARMLQSLPRADLDEAAVRRALEVQAMLAERSQHRGVSLPDLLIAACAEQAELTVLHYDADFELISSVTGQPTRWVVPRGSVS